MAKGEGNKGKKDKLKIPKEISGVKVPKALRKAGKKALKLSEQPIINEAVAAALLAAAAALRAPPAGARAAAAADDITDAAGEAAREAGKMSKAVRSIAIDVARRTLDAWEESDRKRRRPRGGAADRPTDN